MLCFLLDILLLPSKDGNSSQPWRSTRTAHPPPATHSTLLLPSPPGHSQEPMVGWNLLGWSCWDVGCRTQSQEKPHFLSPLTKPLGFLPWYSSILLNLLLQTATLPSTQLKPELQELILPTPTSNTVSYAPSFKSHLNVSHTFAAWTSQKISKRRASVCSLTHAKGVNNTIKDYNLEGFLF